jgi:hypothetical protein
MVVMEDVRSRKSESSFGWAGPAEFPPSLKFARSGCRQRDSFSPAETLFPRPLLSVVLGEKTHRKIGHCSPLLHYSIQKLPLTYNGANRRRQALPPEQHQLSMPIHAEVISGPQLWQ